MADEGARRKAVDGSSRSSAKDVARLAGVSTATVSRALNLPVRVTEQLIRHGVDAFAFVGSDHDAALYRLLDSYGRPFVLTWGLDRSRRHPAIGFDNAAATREVTRYLLELGHRRF